MAAALIVNPFASAVTDERVELVARTLRVPVVARTERRGHATELARELSADVELLYVFSGDGGFNEVLNGAAREVRLGFVPGGGTSVLPRALGIPRDPLRAAEYLASARPRRISLGVVNGRRFGFSAGIGLDAELVRRVDALGRAAGGRRPGDLRFAMTALGVLLERRGRFDPALEVWGEGRVAFALIANCDPYTYLGRIALHVAPLARFELGLDLVAPRVVRPRVLPRFAAYALCGRGQTHAGDVLYRHDVDRIELACERPLPLQADGEDLGDVARAVVESERDAVTVLA